MGLVVHLGIQGFLQGKGQEGNQDCQGRDLVVHLGTQEFLLGN